MKFVQILINAVEYFQHGREGSFPREVRREINKNMGLSGNRNKKAHSKRYCSLYIREDKKEMKIATIFHKNYVNNRAKS